MRFIPKQCRVCPFRPKSAPGWLGAYSVGDIFGASWHGEPFFCHKAIEGKDGRGYERPGWQDRAMRSGKLCVGGLAFANRIPAPMRSRHPQLLWARTKVKLLLEVECMGPREFLAHHDGTP